MLPRLLAQYIQHRIISLTLHIVTLTRIDLNISLRCAVVSRLQSSISSPAVRPTASPSLTVFYSHPERLLERRTFILGDK